MLLNYRLVIKYDGTRYNGWQRQKNTSDTIQGKIEDVLGRMCGTDIEITGSGRTDAGVHAMGQVANFRAETDMSPEEIKRYLNHYLPEDIAVVKADIVSDRFHSRLNAKKKTYLYRMYTGNDKPVFEKRYVYVPDAVYTELDMDAMRKTADVFIGEHDFKSFCGNRNMKKSTVRNIYDIKIEKTDEEIKIYFTGNGFLQNMVRLLTAVIIDTGRGILSPEDAQDILLSCDRSRISGMMPAKGLILLKVYY